jgi:hypothetical protein
MVSQSFPWNPPYHHSALVTGREHSATRATGSAWEPTPWLAVWLAAGKALAKVDVAA